MELFTYVLHSTNIISYSLQKYKRTINSMKSQKEKFYFQTSWGVKIICLVGLN